jgi:hypothetical protein
MMRMRRRAIEGQPTMATNVGGETTSGPRGMILELECVIVLSTTGAGHLVMIESVVEEDMVLNVIVVRIKPKRVNGGTRTRTIKAS